MGEMGMKEYVDKDGKKHDHIYLLWDDTDKFLKGWYWGDETYTNLIGPYDIIEDCKAALQDYCEKCR